MKKLQNFYYIIGAAASAVAIWFYYNQQKKNAPTLPGSQAGPSGPLSVRNNNPLNLIKSSSGWKGKILNYPGTFEGFESYFYGLRAGVINMRTQYNRGYNTIESFIKLWCPPGVEFGNEPRVVDVYISEVFKRAEIAPHVVFPWDKETVGNIVAAMCDFEAGIPNFSQTEVDKVWNAIN